MHDWTGGAFPYRSIVVVHVASALAFALLHGGSAFVALRLRRERRMEVVRALLELSGSSQGASAVALVVLGLSGLALSAQAHNWRATWVWGSMVALFVLAAAMSILGGEPLRRVRAFVGMPPPDRPADAPPPPDEAAMRAELDRFRGGWLFTVGLAGMAILAWLMVAKPG
jgi:hypothetical protein